MKPLVVHAGLVAPIDRSNIDTDAILPKAFLKSIERVGFGAHLFDEWRYRDPYVEGRHAPRAEAPAFVLNQHPWRHASILLARANFGCGSSREHAAWALAEFGFRVVIASSFSDIFYSNAIKNGLLPVALPEPDIEALFGFVQAAPYPVVTVDLRERRVSAGNGCTVTFEIDDFHRRMLMDGLDEIGLTLQRADEIRAFERARLSEQPWV